MEGEETMLQTSDPSKTREGMRRLQMGYVWELHNLVDTGRSPFIHFFDEIFSAVKYFENCFRYERKDFTVVIQPAFTDVSLKFPNKD